MKQNCKNLFSYPDGSIFTGQEIIDFINYHTTHNTGHTKQALYLQRKFGKVKPNEKYKLFFKWISSVDEYGLTGVNKPRLLRVDKTSPVYREYDDRTQSYHNVRFEGYTRIFAN